MDSHAANQARTFLALFAELRPLLRTDRNLPARLQQRLARERRFGSRDRRLYRELLYTAIRHLPWIEAALAISDVTAIHATAWLAADVPATRQLKTALVPTDWPELPPTVAAKAAHLGEIARASLLPDWFHAHCPAAFESPNLDALHTRSPLWLRLQTDKPEKVFTEFNARGWTWRTSDLIPDALELLTESDVTQTDAYTHGLIEIQDLGSQLILTSAAPQPGTRWLDACAGAGGKTLQLARLLGPTGHVTAHDIRPAALAELQTRASRAGLRNVSVSPAPAGLFDGVLVDAPCTGSGTWRRSPHLKWCTTEADIASAAKLQRELLTRFAPHVRPGGHLLYATCSLSRVENEDIATAFHAAHPHFTAASPARTILPATHNTDAFFAATFRREL
ncbi:RNA methyltransferase [Nibricoccus aquaticus]|uniref:RNA methyltransferase n=1 Tax=Nibricoccus aquaticus TaxID=2576891 RepID=A0A290QMW9_9BACT|nr:RsmB/NOP family class I SAM-dependent RNA methyltransferase [Nibricoccus aquaticus]ATC65562.1 RNA methyltransferase [Nibricoccus aquaticus]